MSDITSRKVTRWYYRGKGFASKNGAYRSKAYRLLLDELLGESGMTTDYNDAGNSMDLVLGRSKLRGFTNSKDVDDFIRVAFAQKFPHGDTLNPKCEGICQIRYVPNPSYADLDDTFEEYAFPSCKMAQKEWIINKANELIAQEGEDNV